MKHSAKQLTKIKKKRTRRRPLFPTKLAARTRLKLHRRPGPAPTRLDGGGVDVLDRRAEGMGAASLTGGGVHVQGIRELGEHEGGRRRTTGTSEEILRRRTTEGSGVLDRPVEGTGAASTSKGRSSSRAAGRNSRRAVDEEPKEPWPLAVTACLHRVLSPSPRAKRSSCG